MLALSRECSPPPVPSRLPGESADTLEPGCLLCPFTFVVLNRQIRLLQICKSSAESCWTFQPLARNSLTAGSCAPFAPASWSLQCSLADGNAVVWACASSEFMSKPQGIHIRRRCLGRCWDHEGWSFWVGWPLEASWGSGLTLFPSSAMLSESSVCFPLPFLFLCHVRRPKQHHLWRMCPWQALNLLVPWFYTS